LSALRRQPAPIVVQELTKEQNAAHPEVKEGREKDTGSGVGKKEGRRGRERRGREGRGRESGGEGGREGGRAGGREGRREGGKE